MNRDSRPLLAVALTVLSLCLVALDCSSKLPPTTVPPAPDPQLEPFRAALKRYVDATQPFRKQAAAAASTVPQQTSSAPNAETAVRLRQATLAKNIRTKVRPNAAQGEVFAPQTAGIVRSEIADAFRSLKADLIRDELREQNEVRTGNPQPVAVNETVQLPRVPPLLRAVLPPLPEQLEFDFAGRTLVLRDVDAELVVDYLPQALPAAPAPPAAPIQRESAAPARAPTLAVPTVPGTTTVFAVVGDSGSGDAAQQQVADAMVQSFTNGRRFPFVLMLGDNLYHDDYQQEFSIPDKPLLDRGVSFYAALGNHDRDLERYFKPFHMGGQFHYAFTEGNARFVALDSNRPDEAAQIKWFDGAWGDTGSRWRIAFFHHPLYSSGPHAEQSRDVIRPALEPALVRNHVDVVFSGHEHLYERVAPQHGIRYFVSGGGGRDLYDAHPSDFDEVAVSAHHFMVVEIAGDRMVFEAITPDDRILDCGVLRRRDTADEKLDAALAPWLDACHAAVEQGSPRISR